MKREADNAKRDAIIEVLKAERAKQKHSEVIHHFRITSLGIFVRVVNTLEALRRNFWRGSREQDNIEEVV